MERPRSSGTVVAAFAAFAVLALVAAPAALAKGKPAGGGGSTCVRGTPRVVVANNWAWGSPGSWGLPGQQLAYAVQVVDGDVGCGTSTFAIAVSAPEGFAVSVPASTISLASSASGYLWAYVTSPVSAVDGDYPLAATVERTGDASPAGPGASSYKVYSSDSTAPTLFWSNPWDGQAISGKSFTVTVSSSDDHAVQKIDLSIDGRYVTTTPCDDVTYTCQLAYKWSLGGVKGAHTATFTSYDWAGNAGSLTVGFTVG